MTPRPDTAPENLPSVPAAEQPRPERFVMVGGDAAVCVDGVCTVPGATEVMTDSAVASAEIATGSEAGSETEGATDETIDETTHEATDPAYTVVTSVSES